MNWLTRREGDGSDEIIERARQLILNSDK